MLTKVQILNYKSIASCEVHLGPLTFLVGLNGSGKSNFIDALRFCRDALRGPLDQAFEIRNSSLARLSSWGAGGLKEGFAFRLDLKLEAGSAAHYSFSIGEQASRGFAVLREECFLRDAAGQLVDSFSVSEGVAEDHGSSARRVADDRLYLVSASGRETLRPVYDQLEGMEFYKPDPDQLRLDDTSGRSDILLELGRNLPSVFERIAQQTPEAKNRITEYLKVILPNLLDVLVVSSENAGMKNSRKFLGFVQDINDRLPRYSQRVACRMGRCAHSRFSLPCSSDGPPAPGRLWSQ
jgi:predicted ATPase